MAGGGVFSAEATRFTIFWDLASAFLLLIVTFLTPMENAFLSCAGTWSPRWILNQIMTIFFSLDMLFQFNTPYVLPGSLGRTVVKRRSVIVKHYLKTWFLIDFISVFPFDLVSGCDEGSVSLGTLRVIRLLRLLKLLRLLRGMRIFQRWEVEIGFSQRKFLLYVLLAIVVISGHFLACVLGILARFQGDNCSGDPQYYAVGCTITWLTRSMQAYEYDDNPEAEMSVAYSYLVSLHASMSIIVHPHHYAPTGSVERVVFVILLTIGGFIWALLISRSTAICTSLDKHNIDYRMGMDDFNLISSDLGLSPGLRRRMRAFLIRMKDGSKYDTWNGITRRMSPQLRREAVRETTRTWIMKVKFLSQCPIFIKTDLSEAMFVKAFAENEMFGEIGEMYIVTKGSAILNTKGQVAGIGHIWGDDHLLLTCVELLEDNTATSMIFVQVQGLDKYRFDEIMQSYPDHQGFIRRAAVKKIVHRGVKAKAKQVLEERGKASQQGANTERENTALSAASHIEEQRMRLRARSLKRKGGKPTPLEEVTQKDVEELAAKVDSLAECLGELSAQQAEILRHMMQLTRPMPPLRSILGCGPLQSNRSVRTATQSTRSSSLEVR